MDLSLRCVWKCLDKRLEFLMIEILKTKNFTKKLQKEVRGLLVSLNEMTNYEKIFNY